MASPDPAVREAGNPNAGWIAGALAILAILAAGAALWFHFHP